MTRETKIGLLVGLAFIIVIGVLLSDHLSNTSADPQARLTESGPNVRSSYTIPASTAQPPKPVIAQSSSTPQNELPTKDELNTPTTPNGVINVAIAPPGGEGAGATVTPITMAPVTPAQPEPPLTLVATDLSAPAVTHTPTGGKRGAGSPSIVSDTTTSKIQSGELHLVPVADDHEATSVAVATTKAKVLKEYKAEAGDTLSRMARKFYGSNAKANVDAILAANPQMKGDAARVYAGRTYVIPTLDAAKASSKTEPSSSSKSDASQVSDTDRASASLADTTVKVALGDGGPAQLIPTAQVPPTSGTNLSSILGIAETAKPDKTSKTEKTADKADSKKAGGHYTAKDGDTLWKIAASQMGSGTSWKDLRDANKDVLKGSDTVRPGMVLKLPSKK